MTKITSESDLVKKYVNGWASDFNLALEVEFQKTAWQKLLNWLFQREKLLGERDQALLKAIKRFPIKNKKILDVGCGTGQNSFVLARMGAKVTGLDFSEKLIKFCRVKAKNLGLQNQVQFKINDLTKDRLPSSDFLICSAVIEFYQDLRPIFEKFAQSAAKGVIISDARFVFPRSFLRIILGRIKKFPVYFHHKDEVKKIAASFGLRCILIQELSVARIYVFKKIVSKRDS